MDYEATDSYDGSGLEIFNDEINDKEVGELSFSQAKLWTNVYLWMKETGAIYVGSEVYMETPIKTFFFLGTLGNS